ncbi:MAG: glycerol-3-phosphate dehydrogenase [Clostridiales bacterium GWE2_32_10]|nr:MAG: glycerol-3-phosphate dehydrogenase [Clostridiales bacterium GWE2_32_10]HBY20879.1 glycerol-3-phosphate dehydrogenase [Clostridiales bacterium]
MKKIAIIGSGTWGTALALLLHKNGHEVCMWSWKKEDADEMSETREHKNLKNIKIPVDIQISSDLEETIKDKEILVIAVPSIAMRENLTNISECITKDQVIIIASKGVEEATFMMMTDVASEIMPENEVAAISGPSHAEEVAEGIPTTCVITAKKKTVARMLQDTFMSENFRVYINPDMLGVELGAALKNVIALAAGIADGLELGDNTKAALMTRGLLEITKIGIAMGADQRTFYGLTGFGDLIVTCNSMHSRNRRMGILLGKGYNMQEALKEVNMVVEGVYSAKVAYNLAKKFDIDVPIIESVNKVLFENVGAKQMVTMLMQRRKKEELTEDMESINMVKWE